MYEPLLDPEKPQTTSFIMGSLNTEPLTTDQVLPGLNVSFQFGNDLPQIVERTNEEIDFVSVLVLFLLCSIFPFFYTIALVVDIHNKYPTLLSRAKAIFLVAAAIIFTTFFWVHLGLWFAHHSDWPSAPPSEIKYLVYTYLICCGAEAVLKSSFYIHTDSSFRQDIDQVLLTESNNDPISLSVCIRQIQNQTVETPIRRRLSILNFILAALLALSWEYFRFHLFSVTLSITFISFIISGLIIRFLLGYFIFHYLTEALIQIYFRYKQSCYFQALTSASSSLKLGIPHIKLTSKENVYGWMLIRSVLLREYQSKLFVEIILSTTCLIALPPILLSTLSVLMGQPPSLVIFMSTPTSLILFIYMVTALYLSIKAREGFSQIHMLQMAKLYSLYDVEMATDTTLVPLLDNIMDILQVSQNEAIIFRILGIGISRSLLTVFIGLMVSASTALIPKLFSQTF